MIFAEIHPFSGDCAVGESVGSEGLAIVIADEILSGATAEGAAGVEVEEEHPFLLAVDFKSEEVGTFPDTTLSCYLTERTGLCPGLEVGGSEEEHFMFERVSEDDCPELSVGIIEHVGVAGLSGESKDGISGIFLESDAAVGGAGEALGLHVGSGGVESHYGILAIADGIIGIECARTAEDSSEAIRLDCGAFVGPVDEVAGCGVSPGHVLPFGTVGIPLVVEMPDTVVVEHTVGVVHPTVFGGMVVEGTEILAISLVECVGGADEVPAGFLLAFADGGAVVVGADVEDDIMAFVFGEIEWNFEIDFGFCEADVESAFGLAIDYEVDAGIIDAILDG